MVGRSFSLVSTSLPWQVVQPPTSGEVIPSVVAAVRWVGGTGNSRTTSAGICANEGVHKISTPPGPEWDGQVGLQETCLGGKCRQVSPTTKTYHVCVNPNRANLGLLLFLPLSVDDFA